MGRLSRAELTVPTSTKQDELGAVRMGPFGRQFRYIFAKKKIPKFRVVGNRNVLPTAAGVGWSGGISAAVNLSACPLGVAFVQISASQYGYIMSRGPLGNLGELSVYAITDGGVAAGDSLVKDESSAVGRFDTATNTGTQAAWIMGKAQAADSGSYLAAGIINAW